MSTNSTREYLRIKQSQYIKASRKERNFMLDEIVSVTGLNRKYVIQLLGSDLKRQPRQRQRGRTYGPDVEAALLVVAESLDFICGQRLQPALLSTALDLERHREIELTPKVKESLGRISISTIDRILARHREEIGHRLPRRSPTRPNRVQQAVPMMIIPWDEREPGSLETDLVWHSLSIIARYGASGFRPRWATQREGARETPGGKTIGSLKLACLCGRHLLFDAM